MSHFKKEKIAFSSKKGSRHIWVLSVFFVMIALWLAIIWVEFSAQHSLENKVSNNPFILLGVIAFLLAIYGFRNNVFSSSKWFQANNRKYATSKLKDEDFKNITQLMKELIWSKKLYLQEDLRLHKISKELKFTENELSQALNHKGTNFYDFINCFRLKHAKQLISDSNLLNNLTIDGIASESGFSSRSTFYRYVKKTTGLTPSEYLKAISKSSD